VADPFGLESTGTPTAPLCPIGETRPGTAAAANCSTAREIAAPGAVGGMRQLPELPRISALRRDFPTIARDAPLATVRVGSRSQPARF